MKRFSQQEQNPGRKKLALDSLTSSKSYGHLIKGISRLVK